MTDWVTPEAHEQEAEAAGAVGRDGRGDMTLELTGDRRCYGGSGRRLGTGGPNVSAALARFLGAAADIRVDFGLPACPFLLLLDPLGVLGLLDLLRRPLLVNAGRRLVAMGWKGETHWHLLMHIGFDDDEDVRRSHLVSTRPRYSGVYDPQKQ